MQYVCLIYEDEQVWQGMSEDERNTMIGEYGTLTQSIRESGNMVAGDALQPTSTATTVRIRNGETLLTDGPFAETKEQLGSCSRLSSKGCPMQSSTAPSTSADTPSRHLRSQPEPTCTG